MYGQQFRQANTKKQAAAVCLSTTLAKSATGLNSNSFSVSDFLQYKIAVNQKEMQSFDRPSNHNAEARSPAHSSMSIHGAGHNHSIHPMTIQFRSTRKNCPISPIESIDARLQQEMHCDATGMCEKEIKSADLLYLADSNAYSVNKMLTPQYIFDHSFLDIIGEAELPLQS